MKSALWILFDQLLVTFRLWKIKGLWLMVWHIQKDLLHYVLIQRTCSTCSATEKPFVWFLVSPFVMDQRSRELAVTRVSWKISAATLIHLKNQRRNSRMFFSVFCLFLNWNVQTLKTARVPTRFAAVSLFMFISETKEAHSFPVVHHIRELAFCPP